ncbi:MAG: hypothetical protein LBR88_04095 [Zoogloeaceae bacterium]|jgi:hypothetical protein|nr:hypothetical protein [Zoogloeaceae bacterium]
MALNAQAGAVLGKAVPASPVTQTLTRIVQQGPEVGIHCVLHYASRSGFEQSLGKNLLPEFENRIWLRGGDSHALQDPHSPLQPIKAEGAAYIATPQARYETDPVRLYDPEGIFAALQGDWA